MTRRSLTHTLALASIVFTLGVWVWIFIQPPGTFHDQGGLAITIIYFPATFATWLGCAVTSLVLALRRTGADASEATGSRGSVFGLLALGLVLSIGTLFIA